MSKMDGSEPAPIKSEPPAPGVRRFSFFSLRDHTFVDYATQGYLVVVAVLALFLFPSHPGRAALLLAAHVVCLLAVQTLIRAHARPPENRALDFLRHFYPILLYAPLYREIGELNQVFIPGYLDGFFIRLENQLFGCQPSILFMEKLPYLPVSELFYMSYFSYYLMIAGVGLVLYTQDKRRFWHYVSLVSFVFYVCYVIYIFLPVVGPRLFYAPVPGFDQRQFSFYPLAFPAAVQGGPFFQVMKLIYDYVETSGAAFPSSHVAIAICTLCFSWRFIPKIRWIHLVVVVLLWASTVFYRYHYVVDVFAGALTGAILIPLGKWLYRKARVGHSPARNRRARFFGNSS